MSLANKALLERAAAVFRSHALARGLLALRLHRLECRKQRLMLRSAQALYSQSAQARALKAWLLYRSQRCTQGSVVATCAHRGSANQPRMPRRAHKKDSQARAGEYWRTIGQPRTALRRWVGTVRRQRAYKVQLHNADEHAKGERQHKVQ